MCMNLNMGVPTQSFQIISWSLLRNQIGVGTGYTGLIQVKTLWPLLNSTITAANPAPAAPAINFSQTVASGCISLLNADVHPLSGRDFGPNENLMLGPNSFIELVVTIPPDTIGSYTAQIFFTFLICTY